MNLTKRLVSIAAVGAISAGLLVTIGSGAAMAAFPATPGQLTLTPASGNESTGLSAQLSQACPADSTGLVGYISGPGVTESQGVIQGNRPVATSFQISGIFKDAFARASVAAPNGAYTVRIACIGSDSFTENGSFVQTVNFTPRTGTNNATYVTVVPAAATTTTLAQNNASGAFGSSVTFTADATDGVAGSVQFKDGANALGTPQTVDAAGVASFTTTSLTVGTHPITAVFTPSDTAANAASTSNGVSHVVTSIGTTLGLTSNGPTAQYSAAVFTATVSPAVAGTATFAEGATVLGTGTVNGSGVATFSTTGLSVGTHSVTAHFAPGAGTGATASDSPAVNHAVTAFAGVSRTETVMVTVPAGDLVMVLNDGADGEVNLGTAQMNTGGDLLTASGEMDRVKVTDTRAGDPGWTASGIVSNFVHGSDQVNGYNLGWVPAVVTSSANQVGIAAGSTVTAASEGSSTSTPSDAAKGLKTSRTLAVALDNSGNGTAVLGALLSLNIPTDVQAGTYAATLTLTVA